MRFPTPLKAPSKCRTPCMWCSKGSLRIYSAALLYVQLCTYYLLTDSFVEKVEDFGVIRVSVFVLSLGNDVVDGSRVKLFQSVGFEGRKFLYGIRNRNVDGFPRAGILVYVILLRQGQPLKPNVEIYIVCPSSTCKCVRSSSSLSSSSAAYRFFGLKRCVFPIAFA